MGILGTRHDTMQSYMNNRIKDDVIRDLVDTVEMLRRNAKAASATETYGPILPSDPDAGHIHYVRDGAHTMRFVYTSDRQWRVA